MNGLRRRVALVAIGTVGVLLSGCGGEDRQAAEQVVDQYFLALKGGSVDHALDLYGAQFYATMPRDQWRTALTRWLDESGGVRSYRLTSWRYSQRVGTNAGSYVALRYAVSYQRREAVEVFTVFSTEREPFRIVGHALEPVVPAEPAQKPGVSST